MISNIYANKILNCMLGRSDSMSLPTNLYLGLSATAPDAATGSIPETNGEPTADSYARVIVAKNRYTSGSGYTMESNVFGAADGGVIQNVEEIQFKTARESWGKMDYFFLSESASGVAIMWGEVYNKDGSKGITINAETVPVFYEGDLRASIDVAL